MSEEERGIGKPICRVACCHVYLGNLNLHGRVVTSSDDVVCGGAGDKKGMWGR